TVVLRQPTQHRLTVGGSIVDARIPSPENGVFHDWQPSSNQLSIANGLAGIDALMKCVWIYDLVIDPNAKRRQVPKIGTHVGAIRGVDDNWMRIKSGRSPEQAHLVPRWLNIDQDTERRKQRRGPWSSTVDDHRGADYSERCSNTRHLVSGSNQFEGRCILYDNGSKID